MKRRISIIVATLVLALAIPAAALAAPASSPFDGTWVSEDYDGSSQLLLYVYDSGSDTLTDSFGIVWYRWT